MSLRLVYVYCGAQAGQLIECSDLEVASVLQKYSPNAVDVTGADWESLPQASSNCSDIDKSKLPNVPHPPQITSFGYIPLNDAVITNSDYYDNLYVLNVADSDNALSSIMHTAAENEIITNLEVGASDTGNIQVGVYSSDNANGTPPLTLVHEETIAATSPNGDLIDTTVPVNIPLVKDKIYRLALHSPHTKIGEKNVAGGFLKDSSFSGDNPMTGTLTASDLSATTGTNVILAARVERHIQPQPRRAFGYAPRAMSSLNHEAFYDGLNVLEHGDSDNTLPSVMYTAGDHDVIKKLKVGAAGTGDIHVGIYSSDKANGGMPLTLVHQETLTSSSPNTDLQEVEKDTNIPLKKGKTYLLALHSTDSMIKTKDVNGGFLKDASFANGAPMSGTLTSASMTTTKDANSLLMAEVQPY